MEIIMEQNPLHLEDFYKKYTNDLPSWLPEGVIDVDLALLHRLGILNHHTETKDHFSLTRYFQVSESLEKITLINEQFVIWIVPEKIDDIPTTYTLVCLNRPKGPQLELAFCTWGIYNSSRLVLRVLEKFLYEIQETEDLLTSLKNGARH